MSNNGNDLQDALEQRADYIPVDQLIEGTATGDFFDKVHARLTERGTRFIVGPRGCGKTHMMRFTWATCVDKKSLPFCIYTSFNKYLRLEPLLQSRPNAVELFHLWVLAQIVFGTFETAEALYEKNESALYTKKFFGIDAEEIFSLIEKLQSNSALNESDKAITEVLTINRVKRFVEETSKEFGRTRSVLLLDDAALILTPEYLIEFFDIVRSVKSPNISPKASIYPGTTEFGPRFHATQEGEFIPVWLPVDNASYNTVMTAIAERRFSKYKSIPEDVSSLMQYAAFGIPRAYLSMLNEYERGSGRTVQQSVNKIIQDHISARIDEYRSLAAKSPKFETLIKSGEKTFHSIVREIKTDNDDKLPKNEKQLMIGINLAGEPVLVERLFSLLVEAGLLYQHQSVSHGGLARIYERFTPHIAALIEARAFSMNDRGFSPKITVSALEMKATKHPIRRNLDKILSTSEIQNLKFDLPACPRCSTARLQDAQKFCHVCGAALTEVSTYNHCLSLGLTQVAGLTKWQLGRISEDLPRLRTIGDLLALRDPGTELRKIRQVGPKRATRMVELVISFVDEFLS